MLFDLLRETFNEFADENLGHTIRVKKTFYRDVIHPGASQNLLVSRGFTKKELRQAQTLGYLKEDFYVPTKNMRLPVLLFTGRIYRQRTWYKRWIEMTIGKLLNWKYYLTIEEVRKKHAGTGLGTV